jgi:HD-GYP domain-containing protein (c-di-GMP phosphodiesterase class II)
MRRHPCDGRDIICGLAFLADAARAVLQHHEYWDGSGYPAGLRGEEIDLNARILTVADAFDAMVSDRAYRRARTFEEASAELDRCAGTQFDPRIVEAFGHVPRGMWEGVCAGTVTPADVALHSPDGGVKRAR